MSLGGSDPETPPRPPKGPEASPPPVRPPVLDALSRPQGETAPGHATPAGDGPVEHDPTLTLEDFERGDFKPEDVRSEDFGQTAPSTPSAQASQSSPSSHPNPPGQFALEPEPDEEWKADRRSDRKLDPEHGPTHEPELELEPDPNPPRVQAAPEVGDERFPCPTCGYDLRGRHRSARCPECGSRIPRSLVGVHGSRRTLTGAPTSPEVRRTPRENGLAAWHSLAFLSLPPILLLTPLPCLLPFGVAFAVAAGFAPAFRLLALRSLGTLPTPRPTETASHLRACQTAQVAELACVAVVLGYAAVATFGVAPRSMTAFYVGTLLVWAIVAALGLVAQLRLGSMLAAQLGNPAAPAPRGPERARLWLFASASLAAFGGICLGLSAWPSEIRWLGGLAATILVLADVGLAVGALVARAQASEVGERVFSSPFLRARERIEPLLAPREAIVPRRPPPTGPDEPPIPLA